LDGSAYQAAQIVVEAERGKSARLSEDIVNDFLKKNLITEKDTVFKLNPREHL
jgi:hypothetical protein